MYIYLYVCVFVCVGAASENKHYVDAQVFEILFWNYSYVIHDKMFAQFMEMKKKSFSTLFRICF